MLGWPREGATKTFAMADIGPELTKFCYRLTSGFEVKHSSSRQILVSNKIAEGCCVDDMAGIYQVNLIVIDTYASY